MSGGEHRPDIDGAGQAALDCGAPGVQTAAAGLANSAVRGAKPWALRPVVNAVADLKANARRSAAAFSAQAPYFQSLAAAERGRSTTAPTNLPMVLLLLYQVTKMLTHPRLEGRKFSTLSQIFGENLQKEPRVIFNDS
jgi:hypothetical protein